MRQLHSTQAQILTLLLDGQKKFAELNVTTMSNDWFSYHLRQSIAKGWVIKITNGYKLSMAGKNLALQLDTDSLDISNYQRLSVLLVVQNGDKYLVQQRSTEPFKGVWEFPTSRIPFGYQPSFFAESLLQQETSLKANFTFIGINQKIETRQNSVFDDKYYLVFYSDKLSGRLQKCFSGGSNHWLSKEEFLQKSSVHFDLDNTFDIIENKTIVSSITGEIEDY